MKNEYLIISPVKDEEKYIEQTLLSVIRQTVKPVRWVIYDDGSTDSTLKIIENYSRYHDWIYIVERSSKSQRNTGTAEILAFNAAYKKAGVMDYNFIVKLDGDLSLPEDYFERLLNEFDKDDNLGIASGVYLEDYGKGWEPVDMPHYHAAGASKVVRKECFDAIGGFLAQPGWDTADEIKAMYLGWKTGHFEAIRFQHLKNEGSGMGILKTNVMHGEIFYLTGGNLFFFLLKFFRRVFLGTPPLLAGLMMLHGYLKQMAGRGQLLVNEGEARHYNELLRTRLLGRN